MEYRNRIEQSGVAVNESYIDINGREISYAIVSPYNVKSIGISEFTKSVIGVIEQKRKHTTPLLVRFYVSDVTTQSETIRKELETYPDIALSIVGQPPLNGTKAQAVILFDNGTKVTRVDDYTIKSTDKHGESEYWTTHLVSSLSDSYNETHSQLERYEKTLVQNGMTILDNCVRTWFYVRDIDRNYAGMVNARRENFEQNGLTKDTHYISSTGIEGRDSDINVTSIMDAVALSGLKNDAVKLLYARENMNPTIEYGVTFERGVSVRRNSGFRQIYISGTASIDNHGEVMHIGDIERQTKRMIENVEALLVEDNATTDDLAYAIIYLRDIADYDKVNDLISDKIKCPYIIVHAPVCRPAWLIEMEAVGLK